MGQSPSVGLSPSSPGDTGAEKENQNAPQESLPPSSFASLVRRSFSFSLDNVSPGVDHAVSSSSNNGRRIVADQPAALLRSNLRHVDSRPTLDGLFELESPEICDSDTSSPCSEMKMVKSTNSLMPGKSSSWSRTTAHHTGGDGCSTLSSPSCADALPPEIWQQIAAFLPSFTSTLHCGPGHGMNSDHQPFCGFHFRDLCHLSMTCKNIYQAIYSDNHCNSELLWAPLHKKTFRSEPISYTASYRDQLIVFTCVRRLFKYAFTRNNDWTTLRDINVLLNNGLDLFHGRERTVIFCQTALGQRPTVPSMRWLWNLAHARSHVPDPPQNPPGEEITAIRQYLCGRSFGMKIKKSQQMEIVVQQDEEKDETSSEPGEQPATRSRRRGAKDHDDQNQDQLQHADEYKIDDRRRSGRGRGRGAPDASSSTDTARTPRPSPKAIGSGTDATVNGTASSTTATIAAKFLFIADAIENGQSYEPVATVTSVSALAKLVEESICLKQDDLTKWLCYILVLKAVRMTRDKLRWFHDQTGGSSSAETDALDGRAGDDHDLNIAEPSDGEAASAAEAAAPAAVVAAPLDGDEDDEVYMNNRRAHGADAPRRGEPSSDAWSGLLMTWGQGSQIGGIDSIAYPRLEQSDDKNELRSVWDDVGFRLQCKWNGMRYEGALSDERARVQIGCMIWKTKLLDHFAETKSNKCRPREQFVGVFGDSPVNKFGVAFVSR